MINFFSLSFAVLVMSVSPLIAKADVSQAQNNFHYSGMELDNTCLEAAEIRRAPTDAFSAYNRAARDLGGGAVAVSVATNDEESAAANAGASEVFYNAANTRLASSRGEIKEHKKRCKCTKIQAANTTPPNSPQGSPGNIERRCKGYIDDVLAHINSNLGSGLAGSGKSSLAKKALMVGAIGGVGYLLLKGDGGSDDKDDEPTEEEIEADKREGYITLEDGQRINCFSTTHFQREDCNPVLISMCQRDDKKNTSGCNAFNNFHCGVLGAGLETMYCQYTAAELYCSGTGDVLDQSPACEWISDRPREECEDDPEAISCRLPVTQAELDEKCVSFPNDPICKVKDSLVVTQPDAGTDNSNGIEPSDAPAIAADDNADDSPLISEESVGDNTVDLGDGQGAVAMNDLTTSSRDLSSTSTPDLLSENSSTISSLCSQGLLDCNN